MNTPKWVEVPCVTCGGPTQKLNGLWLRERREKSEMSLRAFARQVKLSAPYISDIERNNRNCPQDIQRTYEQL